MYRSNPKHIFFYKQNLLCACTRGTQNSLQIKEIKVDQILWKQATEGSNIKEPDFISLEIIENKPLSTY